MIKTVTNHFHNQLILFLSGRSVSSGWKLALAFLHLSSNFVKCLKAWFQTVFILFVILSLHMSWSGSFKQFDVSLLYILSNLNISLLLDITPTIITNDLCWELSIKIKIKFSSSCFRSFPLPWYLIIISINLAVCTEW